MRMPSILHGAPIPLVAGFVVFLSGVGYIVASSLAKPSVAVFAPTAAGATTGRGTSSGPDTLTIDARDERRWMFVDLHAGTVLTPPDTAAWDVAVRRHKIIASGAIADLGEVDFASVATAPADGFVRTTYGADTSNAAVGHWYIYNMLTHVLDPNGHVLIVRPRDGDAMKMQIVSYYCPGIEAGCLTIRFSPLR